MIGNSKPMDATQKELKAKLGSTEEGGQGLTDATQKELKVPL